MSVRPDAYTRAIKPHCCVYCGCRLVYTGEARLGQPYQATQDHIDPERIRNGRRVPMVWCCKACNESKANLTLPEWRVVLSLRRSRVVIFHFERELIRLVYNLYAMHLARFA